MHTRDHERVVRSGAPEMIGPGLVELARLAYENALHHRDRIIVAGEQCFDPVERGDSKPEDGGRNPRTATSRQRPDGSGRSRRSGPIHLLASKVSHVIECPRIAVVARSA